MPFAGNPRILFAMMLFRTRRFLGSAEMRGFFPCLKAPPPFVCTMTAPAEVSGRQSFWKEFRLRREKLERQFPGIQQSSSLRILRSIEIALTEIALTEKERNKRLLSAMANWITKWLLLGFFSLAVSQEIDPARAISIFRMRDAAETPYAVLESRADGAASRGNSSAGRQNRFAPWFISSLIRYEIAKACRKLDLATDEMIQSMEQVILTYTAEDKYEAARNLTLEAKALLGEFGIAEDTLELLAAQFSDRSRTDSKNPVRSLPASDFPVMRRNSHQVGKHAAPAGKTASDIPDDGSAQDDGLLKEKSKGGRPKGKKDSKPRKGRSDKGKIRGSYGKNKNSA